MNPTSSQRIGIATVDDLGRSNPWTHAFGELVYAFSQLERCSFELLDRFAPASLHDFAFSLPFKQRTQLASAMTVAALSQNYPTLAARWRQILCQAVELADFRNKVLHNPLLVEMHQAPSGEMIGRAAIHLLRKRGSERIELSQVIDAVAEIKALRKEIIDLEFDMVPVPNMKSPKSIEEGKPVGQCAPDA